jgi:hypothetical protein
MTGIRSGQHMGKRVGAQCGVQRHRDRTQPSTAENQVEQLDPIGGHRGHRVGGAHAASGQRRRHRSGALREIGVTQA